MIKTNIKMRVTPEQSRRVQEICFENGVLNYGYIDILQDYDRVIISGKMIIGLYEGDLIEYYDRFDCEIDPDLFIKTNGTCEEDNRKHYNCKCVPPEMNEETYLTKYTSQPKDLESALKKIENLHIALKKKIDKNKNQALEITNLLEQKKDLQEINDTQNNYIKNLENDLDKLNKSVCANSNVLNDYIRELETKVSELQSNLDYKNECTKQLKNDKESLKNEIKIKDKVIKQLIEQINKVNIDIEDTLKLNLDKLKEKDIIISYLRSELK